MVDVWLEVEAHQLHPAAIVVVYCIFASYLSREHNQAAVDENVEKLKKVLEVYEARLSQSKYLAGDFLSLADLSHFTIMHYFMATSMPRWSRHCHTSTPGGRALPRAQRRRRSRSSCRSTRPSHPRNRSDDEK
ncbi:unnamed protein product [Miscanthus lutarioriparius]|uniref:glutathione transferase n=1 Tax=Miscanthus lutarioriparius TaxID=422564 RepID=A0A811RQP4_9POAL|nr:unnamed protein product [Miscanthus lutarioriparius]